MIELTKAEEQVMHYLWNIEKGFLKDIIEQYPDPKPAYTTVSTVVRVLVKKKAIAYNSYGKVNEYYPLIKKSAYSKKHVSNLVQNFFDNSPGQFASFFTKESNLSVSELEDLKALIDEQISEKKK
ncbi:BlaI/MecI/CopY family transcriptional regulator [Carboxylicivirga mesophila]|uniref:BlaI/MecI/CopY family transcriptional regulator n=1 Tax=Carboxylicivirga mesophila TaxID=1166478 RepID=A0ABS5KEZ2_9BACT|nr:BlaI/MecI/CopY family transcriptional regulator [Carboxylicivirga mesophila]MBS2213629.1 BlaI/MecI/CopY family transcriptional regulator [Carboxylicivirga mesophila]